MKYYIVYPVGLFDEWLKENKLVMIKAKNINQAKIIFAESYYEYDELFLEDLYAKTMNFSFAETFFFQTEEEVEYFGNHGRALIDENEFKKRVYDYFNENPEWADLYINNFFSDDEASIEFPDEMVRFTWKKKYMDSDEFIFVNIGKIKKIN